MGGALSYALGTKGVGTMNVEFYTDIDERLPAPIILPPLLDTAYMKGLKVLIADEMSKKAVEVLSKAGFTVEVKTGMKPEELAAVIGEYLSLIHI